MVLSLEVNLWAILEAYGGVFMQDQTCYDTKTDVLRHALLANDLITSQVSRSTS